MEFSHNPGDAVSLVLTPVRAGEHQSTQWNERHLTELEPAVRVSGSVKVRGIEYTVAAEYKWLRFERSAFRKGVETGKTHWQESRSGYEEGYRRASSGKKVGFMTPTHHTIDDVISDALDWMAAEHPEWRHESLRLRLATKADGAAYKVTVAREALSKALEEETAATEALTAHVQMGARVG